ncbi:MAG: hypothetical protein NTW74_13700 [Acidobacteria bacterium]|nr:hypothetical protein [Acidobacteriota bacterium]
MSDRTQFEDEYFTWQDRSRRQSVRSRTYRRHAAYQGIHFTDIADGKTKRR